MLYVLGGWTVLVVMLGRVSSDDLDLVGCLVLVPNQEYYSLDYSWNIGFGICLFRDDFLC